MAIDIVVKSRARLPQGVSGDAFWYVECGALLWALVVDGLGHGVQAAEPARLAVACVSREVQRLSGTHFDPATSMHDMVVRTDECLRGTRGAALGLALLDAERGEGHFVGVGNVEMRVCGPRAPVRPVCTPGIVGARLTRVRVERFDYVPGHVVILHSDGVSSRFELDALLATDSLEDLADGLVATHGEADDLTLLVVRHHA